MNYYEHHLGDYMRDTAHLSMLEDAAYRRLLDAYYVREKPLPADLRECYKLARASAKQEREAVAYVLREFFTLGDDGHHQARADEEIAKFRSKSEKARASINARWERTRAEQQTKNERNTSVSPAGYERNTNDIHRAPVPSPQSPDTTIEAKLHGGEASAKPPRATRKCPDDFVVTEAMADWAKREFPAVPITRETEAFRDHTFKTSISDWPGAWRNWIRRSSQFSPAAAKTTARQAEVAKWLGPLAKQPKQGDIIDMEDGHGPRIAMG